MAHNAAVIHGPGIMSRASAMEARTDQTTSSATLSARRALDAERMHEWNRQEGRHGKQRDCPGCDQRGRFEQNR